ncbi:hypothetical protein B0H13DRAFT_2040375 [Mycena leptocephala]|nr:hypothetical protein B0H13DRAFT_2040375 [Mycena leptocephala]
MLTYFGSLSRSIFKWIPFPEHSEGFLYYHHDPHTTPLEGSIRLRVTSDRAPSIPWQIIMPQLACCKTYKAIRDRLLDESLVTPAELERCRAIFANGRRLTPSLIIFRLNQEFPVNFSAYLFTLTAVGEVLHTIKIGSVFTTTLDDVLIFPWTGSALVHFEPSTLPKYAGRRVIHMRIVKLVNPVACTVQNYKGRILRPEEGELLTISLRGGPSEPWAYDIDSKTKLAAGLRALWDATSIP